MNEQMQRDILVFFQRDARSSALYKRFTGIYSPEELREVFTSMCRLGMVVRTSSGRQSTNAVFCTTKLGREMLECHYGISVPHPDGVEA